MKKPARKATKTPARKVAAVHRVREHKAKKAKVAPHVLEDARPQVEFDFSALQCEKQEKPEPMPEPACDKAQGSTWNVQRGLAATIADYREGYGPEGNCGDMVAHILQYRTLDEIEVFVYDKAGKAYPGCNPGHRRMNCGNVIRGLVNRHDTETLYWLISTSTR